MVAYSFKAQFRLPILARAKKQTIRRERLGRSRHARPGEELQLYTGMRTRYCQIICRAPCTNIQPIRIGVEEGWIELDGTVFIALLDEFARADGFETWIEMRAFWRAEHPGVPVFSGVLIGWGALIPSATQ